MKLNGVTKVKWTKENKVLTVSSNSSTLRNNNCRTQRIEVLASTFKVSIEGEILKVAMTKYNRNYSNQYLSTIYE